jgi:hypothetical protein
VIEKLFVTDTDKRLFFEAYCDDYKGVMIGKHDAFLTRWAAFLLEDIEGFIEDLDEDSKKFAPTARAITLEDCKAWLMFED